MKKTILTFGLFLTINSLIGQTTITLKPNASEGKDAFTYEGNSQNDVNYGSNVQFCASAWTAGGVMIIRSFINFDWNQIPANAILTSANLKLYAWNDATGFGMHSTLSGSNEMIVEKITTQWDENTITANNMPTVSSVNSFITSASTSPDQDFTLDVTTLVQDILDDPSNGYGLAFRLQTEDYYRRMNFCSSDHTNTAKWPEITLTYQLNDIKENKISTISITNPVVEVINVKGNKNSAYQILDLQGRIVSNGNIENNTIKINNLESANYFLVVDNETFKIVKL